MDFDPSGKALLNNLIGRQDRQRLSVKRLARTLKVCPRTVINQIDKLESAGVIRCERAYPGVPYSFEINEDRLEALGLP
jgi:DNA-binding Lrp family transcriptional regulator